MAFEHVMRKCHVSLYVLKVKICDFHVARSINYRDISRTVTLSHTTVTKATAAECCKKKPDKMCLFFWQSNFDLLKISINIHSSVLKPFLIQDHFSPVFLFFCTIVSFFCLLYCFIFIFRQPIFEHTEIATCASNTLPLQGKMKASCKR